MTAQTNATADNAVRLLGAASALGLSKYVVQTKFGNLVAPDEVFAEAGFTVDKESGFAFLDNGEKPTAAKKVAAKKVATKKTAAPAEKE